MKLCVHALLLAMGVISGHKCDESNGSNECDISSNLHLATKATKATKVDKETLGQGRSASYFINEFEPNQDGIPDPTTQKVEISGGNEGFSFSGCIWTVGADPDPPDPNEFLVTSFTEITAADGTFDANGLLVVTIADLENPSFTIFLSDSCPNLGDNVVENGFSGTIYDSIGVPDRAADERITVEIRDALNAPGTDLKSFNRNQFAEPKLVFRDAKSGNLYQVGLLSPFTDRIFSATGIEVDPGEFDSPEPWKPTFGAINPTTIASTVSGDPHLHTMDGGHYTLLQEGSFLLWRFGLPQPHVEWQIFAHYAGCQSFTKGLLLVDTSGSELSSMEITSERCEWQTQSDSKKWSSVSSEIPEVLLSSSSSRMKLVGNQRKDMKKIQLFLADENVPVATLKVMCRPGRHINVKLYMANQKWTPFVSGELKGQRGQEHMPSSKTSVLQLDMREDKEFEVKKTWAELGGSSHAQKYLQTFSEHRQNLGFIQRCDPQSQADARALCQKHFGPVVDSSYLEECVYDVCSGAGEVAAAMAAEMLKF